MLPLFRDAVGKAVKVKKIDVNIIELFKFLITKYFPIRTHYIICMEY